MGPDVHGRHLLGIPSPWLGQMEGLRFCSGDTGEGFRDGDLRLQRETVAGKEAHWILQSDRSAWKPAWSAGLLALCLAWPSGGGGIRMVPINGPFLPSGTSEKN
ncbi:hypothetical protein HispidOSU_010617 [Sigmodon hispidus]